jgi:hypothetical protein
MAIYHPIVLSAYTAHRNLAALENGGYKSHPAFAKYMRALATVPNDHNIKAAGSLYFEIYPKVFFRMFRESFEKHFISHWTKESHLVYMIGGTPILAKSFLQYLNSVDDETNSGEIFSLHYFMLLLFSLQISNVWSQSRRRQQRPILRRQRG